MLKISFCSFIALPAAINIFITKGQTDAPKKYDSVKYGFSVQYPQNWSIDFPQDYSFNDERRIKTGIINISSPVVWDEDQPNAGRISICSQPINREISNFSKDYCQRRDNHLSDSYKNKTISYKKLVIDGVEAEETKTKANYEELYIYYVSFATKKRKFFIIGQFYKSPNKVWDTFKYEPEFDKIVNSLQLLDDGEK